MKHASLAVLAFAASASFAQASTIDGFDTFVALGDSLTDAGMLPALPLPSLDGRFSNGPTFAEVVGAEFLAEGLGAFNLAVGGATAGDENTNPITLTPFAPIATFGGQVDALAPLVPFLGNNPLVSVLFGANDLLQGLGTPNVGQQAAIDVENGIRAVAALDPRFDNFLLINLPDLGMTPLFNGGPFQGLATFETQEFNNQLVMSANALRDDGFNIIEFDLDAFFQDALANLGLDIGPCTADISAPGPSCVDFGIDPDTLFFVDSVHPNQIVHAAAGNAILAQIAPVPLPAGLPLVLTGLAAIGLASRRNRSRA